MQRLDPIMRWLSQLGAWFGGILLLVAVALICVEVVLRKVASISISGIDELSGYALAIGISWSLSLTLLDRAHVRMDSLYAQLPTPIAIGLDMVSITLLTGYAVIVAYFAIDVAVTSSVLGSRDGTILRLPLVVPQSVWVVGWLLFVATAAYLVVRASWALWHGDLPMVRRLVGSRSMAEDVRDELEAVEERHVDPSKDQI